MPAFTIETRIAATVEEAFDLARDIDAHVRSMADSNERAIAGVTSGLIGLGDEVTFKATHFGVPFRMTARVTEFDRPNRFVDEQVKGPFGSLRHEHRFLAEDGGVRMIDDVRFTSPFGPVGMLVDALVLGRYLEDLVRDRSLAIKAELEGDA